MCYNINIHIDPSSGAPTYHQQTASFVVFLPHVMLLHCVVFQTDLMQTERWVKSLEHLMGLCFNLTNMVLYRMGSRKVGMREVGILAFDKDSFRAGYDGTCL